MQKFRVILSTLTGFGLGIFGIYVAVQKFLDPGATRQLFPDAPLSPHSEFLKNIMCVWLLSFTPFCFGYPILLIKGIFPSMPYSECSKFDKAKWNYIVCWLALPSAIIGTYLGYEISHKPFILLMAVYFIIFVYNAHVYHTTNNSEDIPSGLDSKMLAETRSIVDKVKCTSCGHFNASGHIKCLYCGADIASD